MKIGITLPQLGEHATVKNLIQYAKKAEESGIDSLWVLERLLWPTSPQSPYPATPDGSLPTDYQIVLDPLETLSFLAAHTKKIFLGTSIIDMLFHNPVVLGRRFATLDVLSEGRAICGLGIGWSKDEYQASNIPFNNRGKRADEFLQVLEKLWTDDIVEFKGEYYNIPPSKIGPKPVQKPRIPIYLGGFTQNTVSRIINYGADGLLPILFGSLDQLQSTVENMRELAKKDNKYPISSKVILLTYPQISESKSSVGVNQRIPMTGTVEEIGIDISKIKDMGIEHIILGFFFSPIYADTERIMEISKKLMSYAK